MLTHHSAQSPATATYATHYHNSCCRTETYKARPLFCHPGFGDASQIRLFFCMTSNTPSLASDGAGVFQQEPLAQPELLDPRQSGKGEGTPANFSGTLRGGDAMELGNQVHKLGTGWLRAGTLGPQ